MYHSPLGLPRRRGKRTRSVNPPRLTHWYVSDGSASCLSSTGLGGGRVGIIAHALMSSSTVPTATSAVRISAGSSNGGAAGARGGGGGAGGGEGDDHGGGGGEGGGEGGEGGRGAR